MKKIGFLLFVIAIVGVMSVITGCTSFQSTPASGQPTYQGTTAPAATPSPMQASLSTGTIHIADTSLGKILVDPSGMTLYYFASDIPSSGNSTCNGNCAAIWPVFSMDSISVAPPLVPSDFSSIVRSDGTKQVSYRGWPLYYFQKDASPGDMKGENVLKTWFVVKPDETVMIAQTNALGLFLTDNRGRTLYYFASDTSESTSCDEICTAKWPIFQTDQISAPSALKPSDFTALVRSDGAKQTAYMGHPLYYYSGDTKPGDKNGHGVGNLWNVATISGKLTVMTPPQTRIPTEIPTTAPMSYDSGSSGGGGGGY